MTDWPDLKIHSVALWYIRKSSMDLSEWRWTRLEEPHYEVSCLVQLQQGELPVVSYFRTEASWYLFTTRRILGSHSGKAVEVLALDVVDFDFPNFKGYGGKETNVMTLQASNGCKVQLEYETYKAAMAPIYYFMFWKLKYPVMDKIKTKL